MQKRLIVLITALAFAGCASSTALRSHNRGNIYAKLPDSQGQAAELLRSFNSSNSVIHGPYLVSLLGDAVAPGSKNFKNAYGVDSSLMVRTADSLFLGGSIGYIRIDNSDTEGLIEGKLTRYTAFFLAEYRLRLGPGTWSPSVDFAAGPGWFVAEALPRPDRIKAIESSNCKLDVGTASSGMVRGAVQFRLPVLRSTKLSISQGNADLVFGIAVDFGTGTVRYTIIDYSAGTKTESRDRMSFDTFHVFAGLSFRF